MCIEEQKPSAPTAIGSINVEKAAKALKTIENGKVVVIKEGEHYCGLFE